MMNPYVGITYPKVFRFKLVQWLWKKYMCPRHRHLFDEVWAPGGYFDDGHYLYCDACGLVVRIKSITKDR